MPLSIVGVVNLLLILSRPFSFEGGEPYLNAFVKKYYNIALYSDIYWPISFKPGMMMDTINTF